MPVHVAENLTPAQVRAHRLLDNRSHEETSWDDDLLGLELLDLQVWSLDMDLTGFDVREIDNFLSGIDVHAVLTYVDAVSETTFLRLGANCYAIGLSTKEGVGLQGFHTKHMLVLLNEAPSVLPVDL